MIFTDSAIVLIRKDIREADRIASVYTKSNGRLNIRFPGVRRPKGKLKAFCEPFAWSEMRIYLKPGSAVGCAAGGKLNSVFPRIRASLEKMDAAFYFCELLFKMTPEQQPSAEKYQLLLNALLALENNPPHPALKNAFTLRLMKLAGVGLEEPVLGISKDFWGMMLSAPLDSLPSVNSAAEHEKTSHVVRRFIASHFDYPLKTVV